MSNCADIAASSRHTPRRGSPSSMTQPEPGKGGVGVLRRSDPIVRGRASQMDAIDRRLRDAENGSASVILLEGRGGFGKSLLVKETARSAVGFRVGSSRAFPGDEAMAPLLAALFGGESPLLDRTLLDDERLAPTGTIVWLEQALASAAQQRPLVVCIDDAHWIDRGTAAALRILPDRLSELPIVWMLAFRSSASAPPLLDLFAHLHALGGERLTLPPLTADSVAQLIADMVRAEPSPGLLELAALAGGDPALIVELVHGAADEALLHVSAGRADLLDFRVPRNVWELTCSRVTGVSPLGRRTAAVAAALGTTFSFDHLAAMLEVPPAALLEPIEELVRAEVIADVETHLAFHNDLLREAASGTVSATVRHALQRQAIDVLLNAGVSPIEPAKQLAASSEVGDRLAVTSLLAAAGAVSTSSLEVAADLFRRAVDLTAPNDEQRPSLVAEAALLLHAAGRTDEGMAIAEDVLREQHEAEGDASVRLSIARMSDVPSSVRIDAGRLALATPGLGADLRARHLAHLVLNLAEGGELERARAFLPDADIANARTGDSATANVLELAKVQLVRMNGDLHNALARLDSLDAVLRRDDRRMMWLADLRRAELLLAVDRFEAAHELATQRGAIAKRDGHASAGRAWQRFLGRYQLHTGLIAEAAATLGDDVICRQITAPLTPADAATLADLTRIAIHTGDRTGAKALATRAANTPADAVPELRRHATWVRALHAAAEGDLRGAHAALAPLERDREGGVLPMTAEPGDHVQLARIALAVGDHQLARLAASGADRSVRLNPGVNSIAAAAAHVRGLVDDDISELEAAVKLLAGEPCKLAHASALEDLGVHLAGRGDEARAIEAFDEALRLYSTAGATWDSSRVRRRLRDRGIRRRLVKSDRPSTGWDGLTDSEVAVVRLVAQGLSNRAAATQLFVSPHTVSMHLRHVFTKLAINSRVELARLAVHHGLTG
jgi:DNA-binding CsgD family transcriptional regulator